MNAIAEVTQNFSTGIYEKNVSVTFIVPTKDKNGETIPLTADTQDINNSTLLGFTSGNYIINYASNKLRFNYPRNENLPVSPIDINSSDTAPIDHNIIVNVKSTYSGIDFDPSTADSDNIIGDANASGRATFLYAKTKAAKTFYDDVVDSIKTPISVDVFCDKGFSRCADNMIDTLNGHTDDDWWWRSISHTKTLGDGDIQLQKGIVVEGSSSDWNINPIVVNINGGTPDGRITITDGTPSVLPLTVEVQIDRANTDPWLIYQGIDLTKVRFINSKSAWAGVGKTGHVLDTNASSKKTKRLSW